MTDVVDLEKAFKKKNLHVLTPDNTLKKSDPIKSFISGGVGGMFLVATGHPFDLIKVRIQTGSQYSSTFNAAKYIIKMDGIRGLYRGMLTPLAGVSPIFAVCFWGYNLGQKIAEAGLKVLDHNYPLLDGSNRIDNINTKLLACMFAGAFSALPTTLIMTPTERIKVMLQIQGQDLSPSVRKYSGPIDIVRSIGLRNLYRGSLATLARDGPGSVAYFGVYEGMKYWLTKYIYKDQGSSLPVLPILCAGGLAGMANWVLAIPADVIKSRIQAGSDMSGSAILKNLLKNEGPSALFKGLGPALIRAFPANAACFLGVELSLKAMNNLW